MDVSIHGPPWNAKAGESDRMQQVLPGRVAASAAVLGQVIMAVEDFLDQVWP